MGGSLAIVFRDFDFFSMSFSPTKADPVLAVDPNTVLTMAVARQRFQVIPGRKQKVGDLLRTIQRDEPPPGDEFNVQKSNHAFTAEQALGLATPKAPDHIYSLAAFT